MSPFAFTVLNLYDRLSANQLFLLMNFFSAQKYGYILSFICLTSLTERLELKTTTELEHANITIKLPGQIFQSQEVIIILTGYRTSYLLI